MTTSSNNENGARRTHAPAWVRGALDVLGIPLGSNEEADFRRELTVLISAFRIDKRKELNPTVSEAIAQASAIAHAAEKLLSACQAATYTTLVQIEASTPLTEYDPWTALGDNETDRQEALIRLLETVRTGALRAVSELEHDQKSGCYSDLDPNDWISPRPVRLGRQPKEARNALIKGLLRLFETYSTCKPLSEEPSRQFAPLPDKARAELQFVRTVLRAFGEDRLDDSRTRELIKSLR